MITNVNSFAYYLFMQISVHHILSKNNEAKIALENTLAQRHASTNDFIEQFKTAHKHINDELKPLITNYIEQLKNKANKNHYSLLIKF